jgi:hypothetical protein
VPLVGTFLQSDQEWARDKFTGSWTGVLGQLRSALEGVRGGEWGDSWRSKHIGGGRLLGLFKSN